MLQISNELLLQVTIGSYIRVVIFIILQDE